MMDRLSSACCEIESWLQGENHTRTLRRNFAVELLRFHVHPHVFAKEHYLSFFIISLYICKRFVRQGLCCGIFRDCTVYNSSLDRTEIESSTPRVCWSYLICHPQKAFCYCPRSVNKNTWVTFQLPVAFTK